MSLRPLFCFAALLSAAVFTGRATADPITMTSDSGAAVTFTETETGWRWTNLQTPDGPPEGWTINDIDPEFASADAQETLSAGWTLVDARADRVLFEQISPATGLAVRRRYSFGPAANVLRIETSVRSTSGEKLLAQASLLDAQVVGETFGETGPGPASFPLFGNSLFAGIEHVSGEASALGELSDRMRLVQRPRSTMNEDWQFVAAAIVGWTQPGVGSGVKGAARLREAFLQYLDTVRIKPDRIVLHTDTWWTVPLPLTEKNVLANIETLRKGFTDRTGMFFDTYCLDLGWSRPQSFWQINTSNFPTELRPINERLESLGTKMGLWISPGSGYEDALNNSWLQSQGYEMTPFPDKVGVPCMALGTRYQREFKERIVSYAQQYGLGHVIFDFMAQRCDVPSHGHPIGPESRYAIDAGLADVIDALRAAAPDLVLEPMVCGYPPSPWWLMKTAFVVGPAGDDMPYGRGPSPEWLESLITARDVAYRAGQQAWIMPTQALETFDIIAITPGEFENMAAMAVGRGRWFLSTYFKPELIKPEDWDFLAALVRWERANKQYLANAWQIGGEPENREAYGYMFRNPTKDLYCVRNPWIAPREIVLPPSLVATEPRDVRMIYPRREIVGRLEPGTAGLRLNLGPYETVFLETVPAAEVAPATRGDVPAQVVAIGTEPRVLSRSTGRVANELKGFRWEWDGVLSTNPGSGAELCVLVEGPADVNSSLGKILFNGREVTATRAQSAGQFGAAMEASPDNWTWFLVPIPAGNTSINVSLTVLSAEATVGVFVRGNIAAQSEPALPDEVAFPTFHADRRSWSHVLVPAKLFTTDDVAPISPIQ